MSKRKRAIERQKKANSPEKKAKRAKKNYYVSLAAKEKWNEKKSRKEEKRISAREAEGISFECPLLSYESPSIKTCKGCKLKCAFHHKE